MLKHIITGVAAAALSFTAARLMPPKVTESCLSASLKAKVNAPRYVTVDLKKASILYGNKKAQSLGFDESKLDQEVKKTDIDKITKKLAGVMKRYTEAENVIILVRNAVIMGDIPDVTEQLVEACIQERLGDGDIEG